MRETSGYCVDATGTVTGGNPCSSGSTPVVASCRASRSPHPYLFATFFCGKSWHSRFFYKFWQAGHSTPIFLQFFVEHFWQAGYPTQANYQVVLTHDIAHRPGGDLDAKAELVRFLRMALDKGYEFRTVDTYLSD